MRYWEKEGPSFGEINEALKWRNEHKDYVSVITKNVKHKFPPTDKEDCRHPYLWKPEMWAWLAERYPI